MARIRTIKPEFWTDASVGEVSPTARLLFIASWNFADDEGGLDRSAKQLKAQAFPYDVIDCEPLVLELIGAGLFFEYEVGGKMYLHIKGFRKHQKVENPSKARIPTYEGSSLNHRELGEDSVSPQTRYQRTEEKEPITKDQRPKTKSEPVVRVPRGTSEPDWFLGFKLAYPERSGDQNWHGARRAANARMAEGHTAEEFIAGAKRYAAYIAAIGKTRTEFVKQAATFLGPAKPFLEPWTAPSTKAQQQQDANVEAARTWLAGSAI